MMTLSNGDIFRVTGPLCGEFTGHRWISHTKGQWHGALMFSLIVAWTKGWVNNRNASDLKRHHTHYDVTVMFSFVVCTGWQWHCAVRCYHTWSNVSALVEVNLPIISDKYDAVFWTISIVHVNVSWLDINQRYPDVFILLQHPPPYEAVSWSNQPQEQPVEILKPPLEENCWIVSDITLNAQYFKMVVMIYVLHTKMNNDI